MNRMLINMSIASTLDLNKHLVSGPTMMRHIIGQTIFIQTTVNKINMLKLNYQLDATLAGNQINLTNDVRSIGTIYQSAEAIFS